jgi:hypothetical protein
LAGESPEPLAEEGGEDIATALKGQVFQLKTGQNEKSVFQRDLPPAVARLTTEYRLEFWTKISLTNPERTVTGSWLQDGCRHLARLYEGPYTEDSENEK